MTDRKRMDLISAICDRALDGWPKGYTDKLGLLMDVDFADKDMPLDLQRLLDSPYGDFFHDMNGIYQNFNRETKMLENCFVPRSAKFLNDLSDNLSGL